VEPRKGQQKLFVFQPPGGGWKKEHSGILGKVVAGGGHLKTQYEPTKNWKVGVLILVKPGTRVGRDGNILQNHSSTESGLPEVKGEMETVDSQNPVSAGGKPFIVGARGKNKGCQKPRSNKQKSEQSFRGMFFKKGQQNAVVLGKTAKDTTNKHTGETDSSPSEAQ